MDDDNVISIRDDLNLAGTVQEIKNFEKLLWGSKELGGSWLYLIVDGLSGRYVCNTENGNELRFMGAHFIGDLREDKIRLYDLETAKNLCEALNKEIPDETENKILFAPIPWRRLCIIHLAALYDVIQKMDEKGKTKRFFTTC